MDILCRIVANAKEFVPEEQILIFSYPRSGSTWVAELINKVPRTVILWEPLHLRNVPEFRELGFGWRQYIPENAAWDEALETFNSLFKGAYLNHWLSNVAFPLEFYSADRMIVKFVRANGLLPWLTMNFDFEKDPIYLLRHPFAVAASQMKEGSWDYKFEEYEIPKMPFDEIFRAHASFLSTLKTKPEEIVATWCINNKIVLESERHNSGWVTLYYESLLLKPEEELIKLFDRLDMELPPGIFERLSKASYTTGEATFQKGIKPQLAKWRTSFDKEDITRMQRVLDYFGIEVYSKNLLPKSLAHQEKLFD